MCSSRTGATAIAVVQSCLCRVLVLRCCWLLVVLLPLLFGLAAVYACSTSCWHMTLFLLQACAVLTADLVVNM